MLTAIQALMWFRSSPQVGLVALTLLGRPLDAATYAAALPRPAPLPRLAPLLAAPLAPPPDPGQQYHAPARSVSPVTPPGGFVAL